MNEIQKRREIVAKYGRGDIGANQHIAFCSHCKTVIPAEEMTFTEFIRKHVKCAIGQSEED